MPQSESISELVAALAAAQTEFGKVLKDSENPYFKSHYADMASVIRATQPALAKNGLVVIQFPVASSAENQAGVKTTLAHRSGQFVTEEYMFPANDKAGNLTAQTVGSAITYARRYAYQAAVGVAGEDDDGNAAVGGGSKEAAQSVAAQKIAASKKKAGQEGIALVPWKGNTLVITGNGVSIVKANMTEAQKSQFTITFDKDAKGYTLPIAQGNQFAAMAEAYGVKVDWVESQIQPEAD